MTHSSSLLLAGAPRALQVALSHGDASTAAAENGAGFGLLLADLSERSERPPSPQERQETPHLAANAGWRFASLDAPTLADPASGPQRAVDVATEPVGAAPVEPRGRAPEQGEAPPQTQDAAQAADGADTPPVAAQAQPLVFAPMSQQTVSDGARISTLAAPPSASSSSSSPPPAPPEERAAHEGQAHDARRPTFAQNAPAASSPPSTRPETRYAPPGAPMQTSPAVPATTRRATPAATGSQTMADAQTAAPSGADSGPVTNMTEDIAAAAGEMSVLAVDARRHMPAPAERSQHEATRAMQNVVSRATQEAPGTRVAAFDRGSSESPLPAGVEATISSDASSPVPVKIHINQLATHFPALVAQTLIAAGPRDDAPAPITATAGGAPESVERPRVEPLKVIRFQLEPAALGAIMVRMRVTHSRVDVELETDSARTSALLMDARDDFTAAIGEKGMTVESFRVGLAPSSPAPAGPAGAGVDDGQARYSGGGGFANEERPEQQRRRPAPERSPQSRRAAAASIGPGGVIL
jgi:hypothetical protein